MSRLSATRVVFLPPPAGPSSLGRLQLGLAPALKADAHYTAPLADVFSEVLVYDLDRAYGRDGSRVANDGLVRLVERERPDFVLWHALMYEFSEEAATAIRSLGACLVGWFSDDEFRFDDYSRWWVPLLDWCLTTDASVLWAYGAAGGRALRMMWGSDEHLFRRIAVPNRHDVSFVGYKFGGRGSWVSSLRDRGLDVAAYGLGWPAGYLSDEDFVRVINSSKINLCFVGADVRGEHRPVIKGRIFDVCMSGGFLLCERAPGIEEFFVPDEEVVLFDGLDDAVEKIRYYLAHDDERIAIADAGWRRAQRDHKQAGRFQAAFTTIAEERHDPSRRLEGRTALADWSPDARHRRADWHFSWAEALFEAEFPAWRVKEEVGLCLRDDPSHARAWRLARLANLGDSLWRPGGLAARSVRRAKTVAWGGAATIPGLRKVRREARTAGAALRSASTSAKLNAAIAHAPLSLVSDLFDGALAFALSLHVPSAGPGRYRYSPTGEQPLAYASSYAVLLRHLLGDLDNLSLEQRDEWAAYLNGFQCPDGLYRDPLLASASAERDDWWGWRPLSVNVVSALACLDSRPVRPFAFLEELYQPGSVRTWLDSLQWGQHLAKASSAVMNHGALLQFQRDVGNLPEAGLALEEMYEYLDGIQDPQTGLWIFTRDRTRDALARAARASCSLLSLYFYDGRAVRYAERAAESCLRLQNALGGFSAQPNSDAWQDLGASDSLARLGSAGIRREDVAVALRSALRWSWANRTAGGGLVCRRYEGCSHGHQLMTTTADEPDLFGTWARVLAAAYAVACLAEPPGVVARLRWVTCPGQQYWRPERVLGICGLGV